MHRPSPDKRGDAVAGKVEATAQVSVNPALNEAPAVGLDSLL